MNIKRAELPQQMESLVPFLSDGLRVFSNIVPRYLYEWTISTFSSCIWIVSVPRSTEINYHLFSFVHIHVNVQLFTPLQSH